MAPADESRVEPPQIPEFYVNGMGALGGLYDVTLEFGRRTGGSDDFAWACRVTMTWEHLRSTIQVLQNVLEKYEADMGPVRDIEGSARERQDLSR